MYASRPLNAQFVVEDLRSDKREVARVFPLVLTNPS